ncbi:MAG TPA: four helix bundle protein [Candidatus Moranbacteria bacterium]|nr:four helix bundle protein [Candidatus Moranbacteria bacterium]
MHKIDKFYKKAYVLSLKIGKRDRFGIYLKAETIVLEIMEISLSASFELKHNKPALLNSSRIKIEVLKRLFRIMSELEIIEQKKYIELEFDLIEISKMTNGWIKYLKENPH